MLSLDELDQLIASPDEEGVRVRQSSPFAGVLDGQERESALAEASRIWTSSKADRDGEFSSAAESSSR